MDDVMFRQKAALFQKYGVDLSAGSAAKLEEYARLLIEESKVQNVTAVSNEPDIWIRHFLDSAYILRYLPDEKTDLIDIGTGGGVPGIPLSILRGDSLSALLLDSELRKIEFCTRVVGKLALNAAARCARAEELAHDDKLRGAFDIAVSRAMTNGAVLCEMAIPFLKVGGKLLAMKGKSFSDENEGFARAAEKLGAHVAEVTRYSIEDEEKYIIVVRKDMDTPSQYPRRFAKIKRSPL